MGKTFFQRIRETIPSTRRASPVGQAPASGPPTVRMEEEWAPSTERSSATRSSTMERSAWSTMASRSGSTRGMRSAPTIIEGTRSEEITTTPRRGRPERVSVGYEERKTSHFLAGSGGVLVEHPAHRYAEIATIFMMRPPGAASLAELTRELGKLSGRFVPYKDGAPGDNAYRIEWAGGGYLDSLRGRVAPEALNAEWQRILAARKSGGGARMVQGGHARHATAGGGSRMAAGGPGPRDPSDVRALAQARRGGGARSAARPRTKKRTRAR